MTRITVRREIAASPEVVFRTITDVEGMPDANPDVVRVEFLSEQRSGVGTRFRETRRMEKKEMDTDLEVTEFDPPARARMVTDSHGTVWDTTFRVRPTDRGCELEIAMDARPHALLPRIMNPLMRPVFRKGMEKHLVHLARYCEALPDDPDDRPRAG